MRGGFLAVRLLSFAVGLLVIVSAKSVMHEIAGLLPWVCAALLVATAVMLREILRLRQCIEAGNYASRKQIS